MSKYWAYCQDISLNKIANEVIESPKYLSLINKLIKFKFLKYILTQSRFLTYNAKVFNLGINLTYKYSITNIGINLWNKYINKIDLIKFEILN